jgi:beta-glucosidase
MWQNIIILIHNITKKESRLKIPIIYGIDSIHGANYIKEGVLFPQGLNRAATFNVDILEKIGRITSVETRAVGIPWNFSPVLDMGRQPTGPRLYETHGEDTYLSKILGEAFVRGHQGNNNLTDKENAATCLKSYIGQIKKIFIF